MSTHVTVNNRPLDDYLRQAEALTRQAEAEQVRLEEIRQHKRYAPVITRRLILWMPKKTRERIDPHEFELLVNRIRDTVTEHPGITYDELSAVVGKKWRQPILSRVVREIGAARWRDRVQGPVLIGMTMPPGRKKVSGRRNKLATPEQLAAARAREAGLTPHAVEAAQAPPAVFVAPQMSTLRRELVEMATAQAAFWNELRERLVREAPPRRKT